jgi:hypothetical protein
MATIHDIPIRISVDFSVKCIMTTMPTAMSAKKKPANMIIAAVPVPTRKLGMSNSVPPPPTSPAPPNPNDVIVLSNLFILSYSIILLLI